MVVDVVFPSSHWSPFMPPLKTESTQTGTSLVHKCPRRSSEKSPIGRTTCADTSLERGGSHKSTNSQHTNSSTMQEAPTHLTCPDQRTGTKQNGNSNGTAIMFVFGPSFLFRVSTLTCVCSRQRCSHPQNQQSATRINRMPCNSSAGWLAYPS